MKEGFPKFPAIAYKMYQYGMVITFWGGVGRSFAVLTPFEKKSRWLEWLPPRTVGITQDTLVSIRI